MNWAPFRRLRAKLQPSKGSSPIQTATDLFHFSFLRLLPFSYIFFSFFSLSHSTFSSDTSSHLMLIHAATILWRRLLHPCEGLHPQFFFLINRWVFIALILGFTTVYIKKWLFLFVVFYTLQISLVTVHKSFYISLWLLKTNIFMIYCHSKETNRSGSSEFSEKDNSVELLKCIETKEKYV